MEEKTWLSDFFKAYIELWYSRMFKLLNGMGSILFYISVCKVNWFLQHSTGITAVAVPFQTLSLKETLCRAG